jgi:hypothetical protein
MNTYLTRELSLATYLKTHGMTYRGVERITKGSYFFVFENPKKCVETEKEYLSNKQELLDDIDMAERNYE